MFKYISSIFLSDNSYKQLLRLKQEPSLSCGVIGGHAMDSKYKQDGGVMNLSLLKHRYYTTSAEVKR